MSDEKQPKRMTLIEMRKAVEDMKLIFEYKAEFLQMLAKEMKTLYDALRDEGFTEEQSLFLTNDKIKGPGA